MILWRIIYRSLRQHALSTVVTASSIALAGGLLLTVWMVKTQTQRAFVETTTAFDAVLGVRSSKLQLVLNAIFHLEASPGNLSLADFEAVKKHPAVKTAIPIAVGDNYYGWRIVGTIPELFTGVEYAAGKPYVITTGGRLFTEGQREAVVGSMAARRLGLKPGDTFHPFHGLAFDAKKEHDDVFTVVGLLAPTNTPADRVIWIPLAGVQQMSGHDARAATDVSAVLLQLRAPASGMMMDMLYNRQGNRLTLAYPVAAIVSDLFSKIGWLEQVLALVAYLVALVAAGSVLASIHASMEARRRDIAILRALGARRRTVFGAIVAEAATIGALGAGASVLVYAALFTGVTSIIRTQTGVVLDVTQWHPVLLIAPAGLIALAALGGVVPAWKAYRTPVAENLSPAS